MWELDYKESWVPKNWCFWTVVVVKTLKSPLDCKEIQPVDPKGNQFSWMHWRNWHWSWNSNTLATWCKEMTHWKRIRYWGKLKEEGKRAQKNERVGWHHWLNGHEFWISSGSRWWTGKYSVLESMGATKMKKTTHITCPTTRKINTIKDRYQ